MMMAENSQGAPGTVAPEDVITPPPDVTDADLSDYLGIRPPVEEAPATQEPEPEPAPAAPDLAAENAQLKSTLQQLVTRIQQAQQQPTNSSQPQDRDAVLMEIRSNLEASGFNADGQKTVLDDTVLAVHDRIVSPEIQALKQQIAELKANQQGLVDERAVETFDSRLNSLMDSAGIEDQGYREMMRDHIIERGKRDHGNSFGFQHIEPLFQGAHQRLRKAEVQRTESYITDKKATQAQSPPIAHSQGTATGAESVRGRLEDPNDEAMDFKSSHFQNLMTKAAQIGRQGILE